MHFYIIIITGTTPQSVWVSLQLWNNRFEIPRIFHSNNCIETEKSIEIVTHLICNLLIRWTRPDRKWKYLNCIYSRFFRSNGNTSKMIWLFRNYRNSIFIDYLHRFVNEYSQFIYIINKWASLSPLTIWNQKRFSQLIPHEWNCSLDFLSFHFLSDRIHSHNFRRIIFQQTTICVRPQFSLFNIYDLVSILANSYNYNNFWMFYKNSRHAFWKFSVSLW